MYTWPKNPQYSISTSEECTVFIKLQQEDIRESFNLTGCARKYESIALDIFRQGSPNCNKRIVYPFEAEEVLSKSSPSRECLLY